MKFSRTSLAPPKLEEKPSEPMDLFPSDNLGENLLVNFSVAGNEIETGLGVMLERMSEWKVPTALNVGHAAAGLLDNESARGDVPQINSFGHREFHLSSGNVSQMKDGGAEIASLATFNHSKRNSPVPAAMPGRAESAERDQ